MYGWENTLQQVYYRLTDEFTVFQLSPILQEKKLRTDPDIYGAANPDR